MDIIRIECEIVADIPAQLSALLYNALRTFEAHFRHSCCHLSQADCASCALQVDCPYRIVFSQKLASDPEVVRLHQKPPLPFAFNISGVAGNSSSCTLGIVVVGSAVNHVENFHAALLRMIEAEVCSPLQPGKCILRTGSLDYQGGRHEITDAASLPESIILLSASHILQNTVHSGSAKLLLKSPLRLSSSGLVLRDFNFAAFFRSQMRRCSSLYAYYGSGELELDFVRLSESALKVTLCDDKTEYAQPPWSKRLNRAGLTGTVTCEGLVEPMLSLLLLGSYFNAGKGAAYGSGFYHVESV